MRPIAVALAAIVVIVFVASAQGPQPQSVFLEDLTWIEARDAIAAGKTNVIIPTGGTEQNGPHMVLGKHNYLVKYKAGEIAKQLGNALVAPVVAYVPEGDIDPPTGHMRFAGTITTPQDVFAKVLEYAARSFKQRWPTEDFGPEGPPSEGGRHRFVEIQRRILELKPVDETKRWFQHQALQVTVQLSDLRWLLVSQGTGPAPLLPVFILIFLSVVAIFGSFGLYAPPTATLFTELAMSSRRFGISNVPTLPPLCGGKV